MTHTPQGSSGLALSGLGWGFAGQITSTVSQFIINVALARILSVRDYGLLAMLQVFIKLARQLQGLGFGQALIQRDEVTEEHKSAAYWAQTFVGAALTLLFFLSSEAIAQFYRTPALAGVMRWISLIFVLEAAGSVHNQLLRRDLRFRDGVIVVTAARVVAGVLAVALALAGWGVYALVAHVVVQATWASVHAWMICGWHPRMRFSRSACGELFAFAGTVTGLSLLTAVSRKIDDVLIGRVFGAEPLGLYNRAYALMLMPITRVRDVASKVMFPLWSRMQGDDDGIKRMCLKTVGALSLVTTPMAAGLWAVSDEFVVGLLGANWAEMAPIVRWLCIASACQSVQVAQQIFMSKSALREMSIFTTANVVVYAGGVIAGLSWGPEGVAKGVAAASLVLFIPSFAVPGRLIGLRLVELVPYLLPPTLLSIVMAAGVYGTGWALSEQLTPIARLICMVPAGALIYGLGVLIIKPRSYLEVLELLRRKRKKSRVAKFTR